MHVHRREKSNFIFLYKKQKKIDNMKNQIYTTKHIILLSNKFDEELLKKFNN
jgi:hypothetical protein